MIKKICEILIVVTIAIAVLILPFLKQKYDIIVGAVILLCLGASFLLLIIDGFIKKPLDLDSSDLD